MSLEFFWFAKLWILQLCEHTSTYKFSSKTFQMKHYIPWKEIFSIVSHAQFGSYLTFIYWVLMVGGQVANLIFGHFFDHNLSLRSPNGECNPIFDIYISKPFSNFKESLLWTPFTIYTSISNIHTSQGVDSQNVGIHFPTLARVCLHISPIYTFLACSPFMPWLWAQI
jgi:hypothetical protein